MDDAQKLQLAFQTLADANRLRIIKFIGEQECAVSEIVKATGLSQPLVSHHLKTLKNRQFLETRRQGPFIYYKLKDKKLLDALGLFLEIAKTLSDEEIQDPMFCCPPFWRMHHHHNGCCNKKDT
jgi:DNA-binding transcriptional ArsR family regulator